MKIFNEEKSKRVVYVQRNDLAMLDASSFAIPGSCLITGLVDDSNRFNFVRFEDPRIVEFFEGIDWIVDFKSLKGQDDEVYADAYNEVVSEMNDIVATYEGMSELDRRCHSEMLERYELLEHKKNSICSIYDALNGKISMPFPVVADCDGFSVEMGMGEVYRARGCFEPGKFVVFKMDGSRFERGESLPYGFIQNAIAYSAMKDGNRCAFIGSYSFTPQISEDGKSIIVTYHIEDYKDEVDFSLKDKQNKKDAKDVKKFFKSIF